MIPLVDLKAQYKQIKDEVREAIENVISECAFIKGKYVKQFEHSFANYCNAAHAIGASSGTTALHLALEACNIKQGDEVILPSHTFATSEAVIHSSARPIFADINLDTYTIDPNSIEKLITKNTKAIIPVHIYGQMADMEAIGEIAKKYNLKVIEDAAQAHGAEIDGRRAGSIGDFGCFSFYPGKNLGAYGDAGAVTTNSEEHADLVRKLSDHGRTEKYTHDIVGYNYRLDGLQAAILNVKMKYLGEWTEKRRNVAELYNKLLCNIEQIKTPVSKPNCKHVYHLYVIEIEDRDKLLKHLNSKGIGAGIHYPIPQHRQPAFSKIRGSAELPVTENICKRILSLPIYPEMTEDQVAQVTDSIKEFYK